ncbi:unnamed protein product [Echinostoma caproni]|uniref:Transmembrane protein 188 n=1 Tax=Echinostoma caproni TaxID=27848 RepID=A0A183B0T1_9TREM|nr:unnamed protein product [Echinostoma caproni]
MNTVDQRPRRYSNRAGGRWRSSSCSVDESVYPERRHVDVRHLVQQLEELHATTPTQERIKYITITGLFVLYMHNRYIQWHPKSPNYCESSHSESVQSEEEIVVNDTVGSYHWSEATLLDHTNFNMLFFLLIGILLYYRAKFYAFQRTKLLNLDLLPPVENRWQPPRSPDAFINNNNNNFSKTNGWSPVGPRSSAFTRSLVEQPPSSSASQAFLDLIPNGIVTSRTTPKVTVTMAVGEPGAHSGVPSHRTKESTTTKVTASDTELLQLLSTGELKTRDLESVVGNPVRAVELRRLDLARLLSIPHVLERLPYKEYDYRFVHGQCCEEVL